MRRWLEPKGYGGADTDYTHLTCILFYRTFSRTRQRTRQSPSSAAQTNIPDGRDNEGGKDKDADEENNNEDVLVWDTFQTDDEISALCSAINIIGETIDNTLEGEWADEEQEEQYKQTMKN